MEKIEFIMVSRSEFEQLKGMVESIIEKLNHAPLINEPSKLLYSAKEVAELTGYTESTIRRKKNEIGHFDDGGNIKFRHENIIKWIEKHHS